MKGFLKFVFVFSSILLASAVLAPLLYQILPYKFERIFNRLVMIFSLSALWFLLLGKKFNAREFGLDWCREASVRHIILGFGTGVVILSLFSLLKVAVGQADWIAPAGFALLSKVLTALGASFLIGVIEEFFFRGFVYRTLRKWRWSLMLSIVFTSVFYSMIHFVSFDKPFVDSTPTVIDGLRLVAAPFLSLMQFSRYWPEAVGLFLFGLVLNCVAVRSGSLYPSIGLHAGCVLYVKTDVLFLQFHEKERLLYASGKFYDGALGWFFIVVIGLVLTYLLGKTQPKDKNEVTYG